MGVQSTGLHVPEDGLEGPQAENKILIRQVPLYTSTKNKIQSIILDGDEMRKTVSRDLDSS
ncbi:MAG: hypothetical protein KGI25_00905, partial [Thaumarchaeota archaeon]|nr:hypothetical protein [Nitrososphaerota archaeon]